MGRTTEHRIARSTRRILPGLGAAAVLLVLSVLALAGCQPPTAGPQPAAPPPDRLDTSIFRQAAAALLVPLEPGLRLAVRDVRIDEAGVPARVARQVEETLVSALVAVGQGKVSLVTRSEFGKILSDADLQERDPQANLAERAVADGLVVTSVYRVPAGLMLTLRLYDMRPGRIGTVLASTADHLVPIDLAGAFRTDATTAINRLAAELAPLLLEDPDLLTARVRFLADDDAGLTGWLSGKLASSLAVVLPKAREGLWVPVGAETPPQAFVHVAASAQDQGREVLARFRLRRADGRVLAERSTEITSESIPIGIRLDVPPPPAARDASDTAGSAAVAQVAQYEESFVFEPRRTSLDRAAEATLRLVGARFADARDVRFLIESHAGYAGGTHDPRLTAELRAARVRQVLAGAGVPDERMRTRLVPHPVGGSTDTERIILTYGLGVFR